MPFVQWPHVRLPWVYSRVNPFLHGFVNFSLVLIYINNTRCASVGNETKYQIINIGYKKRIVLKFEFNFTYYIYTRFPTPRGLGMNEKEYEYIGRRNFDMSWICILMYGWVYRLESFFIYNDIIVPLNHNHL